MASQTHYNVDYGVVKKPQDDQPLTEDEGKEWLTCANDFWYFATTYCQVVGPKGKVLFEPRDYQIDAIDIVLNNRKTIINSPRQSGKSAMVVIYVLWELLFTSDITSSMASYKLSGAKDLLTRLKTTYEALPSFLKEPVLLYNQLEVRFANGSNVFVQVISENTGRGRTITGTLVLDEHSFVSEDIARLAHASYMPSLDAAGEDSKTKLIIISTPAGTAGLYASLVFGAQAGTNGFVYHKVDPSKIPGRQSPEWEKQKIKEVGILTYRQEYLGEFISSKPLMINSMKLESLKPKDPVLRLMDDTLEIFVDSFKGRNIIVGVDVSEGVGQDNSVFQVLDAETLEQCAEYADNMGNQNMYVKDILSAMKYFKAQGCGDIYMGVESNGVGNGVLRLLETSTDPIIDDIIFINDVGKDGLPTGKSGLTTTKTKKMEACGQFKALVESDRMTLNSVKLINELRFFMKNGASFAAESGNKDDRVMGMMICMYMLPQLANYEDSVDKAINDLDVGEECWGIAF
jgi:hypothetical protein